MIPRPILEKRIASLRNQLERAGQAGAIISRAENVYYFTGECELSFPLFFVVSEEACCLVMPARGNDESFGFPVYGYQAFSLECVLDIEKNAVMALMNALRASDLTGKSIAVESTHLAECYTASITEKSRYLFDVDPLVEQLRYCKDTFEIEQLRTNQALNDLGFVTAKRILRSGMTEIDLYNQIYTSIAQAFQKPFAWKGCLGGGMRSALKNPQPSPYNLQTGDLVLIDIFSEFDHYYSDSTRTFVAGKATERQRKLHSILQNAVSAGEQLLKPGVRASDVDAAIRDVIIDAGYGEYFAHHSGHGVGLKQQERPYIIPGDHSELQTNCVIALEPGIYLPNYGGLRLENVYLILESGPQILTGTNPSLFECI